MKKYSLLTALAMIAASLFFSPPIANAQDDAKTVFEREWYNICYTVKDVEKCYIKSKEGLEKYPDSQYAKNFKANVTNYELTRAWEKFQAALKAYYTPPQDAPKLENLFTAGNEYLKLQPDQPYVVGQLALAGANGALSQTYKNLDRVKGYAEHALRQFEPASPPKDWKPEEWTVLREAVLAQMNQFMGYYTIETKGDPEQAIAYLTKATQVRNKDGAGWKDPNNYWLRANIYSKQYGELRAKYDALTDEQKTGDEGKALLVEVNSVIDKMIPDYARVLATANKSEARALRDAARELFDQFWEFRTKDKEKAEAYKKSFEADPTVPGPPIPVKVEETTDLSAPAAPTANAANVKMATGQTSAAPGSEAKSGNGKKSSSKSKSTRKRPRRN